MINRVLPDTHEYVAGLTRTSRVNMLPRRTMLQHMLAYYFLILSFKLAGGFPPWDDRPQSMSFNVLNGI